MPRRMTQEEFEKKVLEKLGSDYKVLGEYKNKDTKVLTNFLEVRQVNYE